MTQRARRLGWSFAALESARKELECSGYVQSHRAKTGNRGGVPLLLEPTDKAWELLRLTHPQGLGKGKLLHQFWQHTIADHYQRRGATVTIEGVVGSKAVDVLVHAANEVVAIEIQFSAVHIEESVAKDRATGQVDRVVFACDNKKLAKRILQQAQKLTIDEDRHVDVKLFYEFLED